MNTPEILLKKADEIEAKLAESYPQLVPFFKGCFLNTMETTVSALEDGTYFVITGDIPAMWLRDSASQLKPYIRYADKDEELRNIFRGVIARHAKYISLDAYSNAFNATASVKARHRDETDFEHPLIWERKYETDSLCASVYLAHEYFSVTYDRSIFTDDFKNMLMKVLEVFRREQNHMTSPYFFNRTNCPETDTLPNEGKGSEVAYTGMTWSGFRPSDDRCVYGYLVPANMMAVCALKKAAELASTGFGDTRLESECRSLAFEIDEGIKEYGTTEIEGVGRVFAYETDGRGNFVLMDDANSPSLLSAPFLGYLNPDNEIYRRTRSFILSEKNPWYFTGSAAEGIGSPHTGPDKIWHISLIMQALTSTDKNEIEKCLSMITSTDAGSHLMHESFNKDEPEDYTRPWFAWANSLFAELMIRLAEEG